MDRIDNKIIYSSPEVVATYDTERRIGLCDFVNDCEIDYFATQVTRLAGPAARIVDVGAGTGKLTLALAKLGHNVTAIDQSEAMLSRLSDKATASGLNVNCCLHDIVTDPETGETFDVAVSSRVLMHVADPAAMIRRMAHLGRKGLVCDVPRRLSLNRLQVAVRALTGGEVYRCFDDAALLAAVAEEGLEIVDASRLFVLPIGLHYKLHHQGVSRSLEGVLAFARPFASTLFLTAAHPAP